MSSPMLADKPVPYQGVVDNLLQQIQAGQLRPGDKLLATSRLAEHYGVAVPTAHRALTELVRQGYLTRKTGVGTYVRALPGSIQRTTIGAVIRCDGHIWADFADSLLQRLRQIEATTIAVNVSDMMADQIVQLPSFAHLLESQPDAIVVQYTCVGEAILRRDPSAYVISLEADPGHARLDLVAPDLVEVGALAARHLLERGYSRIDLAGIFVIGEGPYRPSLETRMIRDGLDFELTAAGLPPAQLIDIPSGDDASDRLSSYLTSPDRAPALVCSVAHRSAQIVRLCRQLGIDLPGELALVSALESPWTEAYELTAIDQSHHAIAELCVDLIKQHRNGTRGEVRHCRSYRVSPSLIIRQST